MNCHQFTFEVYKHLVSYYREWELPKFGDKMTQAELQMRTARILQNDAAENEDCGCDNGDCGDCADLGIEIDSDTERFDD